MGKPLAFHAAYNWDDRALGMTNRFISVHALGFMWFNMIHMTNWVINGLPERFPKLKVMWVESGLTWAYCLMQRLDHEFMMRTSDCPSLKRKPSEYMREMYYSTQPMEVPEDLSILEATFRCSTPRPSSCGRPTTRTGISICRARSTTFRSSASRPSAASSAATPRSCSVSTAGW